VLIDANFINVKSILIFLNYVFALLPINNSLFFFEFRIIGDPQHV